MITDEDKNAIVLELARLPYEGKPLGQRYARAMRVTPEDTPPVRQAAREELSNMVEEFGESAPSSLRSNVRTQIERLR